MTAQAAKRPGGIHVEVTRPGKLFFPDDGISKGDLVEYYGNVAPAVIPYLRRKSEFASGDALPSRGDRPAGLRRKFARLVPHRRR